MARRIETGSIDIDAIKDQYPLADEVRRHLTLKRRGSTLVGLCPFHMERTPSFAVYPDEQRFHCFGCGAHGDVFDFLEAQEGLDIRAAAERLTGGHFPIMSESRVAELKARQLRYETELAQRRKLAAEQMQLRWQAADPTYSSHPYLTAKGIKPCGSRLDRAHILIPLFDGAGELTSVQTIDPVGNKMFEAELPVAGSAFVIGAPIPAASGAVILCEGFATGASLHEATGRTVVVTFNAGNLTRVAERMAAVFPKARWVVAGDDDRHKQPNVGREAAGRAARILKCEAVFPAFPEGHLGTDFNDMAQLAGHGAVAALFAASAGPDVFETLSLEELVNMPAPKWRIEGLIPEHGLVLLYGRPGEHKTFIAVDGSLRVAYGLDWHGRAVTKAGVLYIAGEGRFGIGQRIKGWRKKHGLTGVDAPFKLLPVAVHMLDPANVEKLKRTIDQVRQEVDFEIGVVVIDTVSRAIPGQDENSQEAMSLFVDACAEIQNHCGGVVIGIHHSGKDAERGMRGSTVLLGGCDTAIRVAKEEDHTVLSVEKQKDGEEIEDVHFTMEVVDITAGFGKEQTTLVPVVGPVAVPIQQKGLNWHQAYEIFKSVDEQWNAGTPWSAFPQAKRRGRYIIDMITSTYGVSAREALTCVSLWQQRGYMTTEGGKTQNRASGLRVLKYLESGQ